MTFSSTQTPYGYIADLLSKGRVVPFLGMGVSISSRDTDHTWLPDSPMVPSGFELAKFLSKRIYFPSDHFLPELMEVASYFVDMAGREALYNELRNIYHKDFKPSAIHRLFATLPTPLVIVTTNYDDLLERAFAEANRSYDLVFTVVDQARGENSIAWWKSDTPIPKIITPKQLIVDLNKQPLIYKIYGTVNHQLPEWDSFVITEDDHINLISRIGAGTAIPHILFEHFTENHFLFIGYSLRDWDIRLFLSKVVRQTASRKRSWAILYSPTMTDVSLWNARGVDVYDSRIDELVKELSSRISTEASKQREHLEKKSSRKVVSMIGGNKAEKALPTVFISYAREDETEVALIYEHLKNDDFKPWLDREEILPGENWELKIRRTLKEADFLVLCLSSNSVGKRGFVQKEMNMAMDLALEMPPDSIFLIPIRLDEVALPEQLMKYHCLDWFKENSRRQLTDAIAVGWQRRLSLTHTSVKES